MAVAYRSSGTFADANATSTGSVGLPAGLANGDILVLVCQARGTGGTITTPSGYTLGLTVVRSASFRTAVFYKYVSNAAGEVAPSVTQTVSGAIRARLSAFSGGSSTTQLDVAVVGDHAAAATNPVALSTTPVSTGAMALWVFSTNDDTTMATPTQGTLAYNSDGTAGADGSIALVYELQGTAAATGTCSVTETINAPAAYIAITLAIRPAAVAATSPATALFDDIELDVDVAFGSGPFTPSPTWTRVTDYVSAAHPIQIQQGRESEDGATNPATLSLVLNNSINQAPGRRFDPDYTSGPYYGQLNLRTPIRVWCRRNSTDHPLFTGHVQSWRQVQIAGSHDSVTEVTAVDVMAIVGNTPCPSTAVALRWLADRPEVYVPLEEESLGPIADVSRNAWTGSYPPRVQVVDSIIRGQTGKKAKGITTTGAGNFDGLIVNMTAATSPENLLTLEAWVKVTAFDSATLAVTGLVRPFVIYAGAVSNILRIEANVTSTTGDEYAYWESSVHESNGTEHAGWTWPLTFNQTTHVCVVLEDTHDVLRLYIDGSLVGSANVTGTFDGGSLTPTLVAGVDGDESTGYLAHVAAYQSALTAEEVQAHYEAAVVGGALQTAAERLDLLAEYAGLTDAELFDTSTMGTHTFLAASDFSGSVLDEMRKIIEADAGRMFVDGYGVLTCQSRITDIEPGETAHIVSQGTYGDDPTTEIRYEDWNREPASESLLQNVVVVNGTEIRDDDSVRLYGPAAAQYTVPIASPIAARAWAEAKLERFATPAPRIDRLTINMRGHLSAERNTAINTTLGLELGHRITATIRPADGLGDDVTEQVRVEGIRDTITRNTWTRDLYLTPAVDAYNEGPFFTIGHATYGRIGTPAGNKFPA